MVKVVAIIGPKKSGKTHLLEGLLRVLTERDYRVGVMKNSHHPFSLDSPGTDTWRLKEAGASRVMLTWPKGAAMPHFHTNDQDKPHHIAQLCMNDLDLVLLEGYKHSPLPKIALYAAGNEVEFNRRGLIATIGRGSATENLPDFDLDDVEGIADFIENRFLRPQRRKKMKIEVHVDGRKIGLKGFVKDILSNAILGMISTLKGCKNPGRIEISLDLNPDEKEQEQ